jgi:hypothetical protein
MDEMQYSDNEASGTCGSGSWWESGGGVMNCFLATNTRIENE